MTLTEFLLARIAEDEAVARDAIDSDRPGVHWRWTAWTDEPDALLHLETIEQFPTQSGVGDLPAFPLGYEVEACETLAMPHIARHDPARVIAECEARRKMVMELDWRQEGAEGGGAWHDLLTYMSWPYSDHPDYDEAWRP